MQVDDHYIGKFKTVTLTIAVTGCIDGGSENTAPVKLARAISLNERATFPYEEGTKMFPEEERGYSTPAPGCVDDQLIGGTTIKPQLMP